jgi:hypothetical protein
MAAIHSLVDNSEVTHPSLKAFLHQRTRQWKYTDMSFNPEQCTELPEDYSSDTPSQTVSQDIKPIHWNEELPRSGSLSAITKALHRLALEVIPTTSNNKASSSEWESDAISEWKDASVLCPTFAGGKESAGECVFTNSSVQHTILSFFEEVAQNPEHYCNPEFTINTDVPNPTADAPFELSADPTVPENSDTQFASSLMAPEQAELDEAHEKLADMRLALNACPEDVDELARGRAKLVGKIMNQEAEIKELQVKALSSGSLRAGEAENLRQDWSPKTDGPQVPFAGTMIDSELLKAAGLGETADEELKKLGDKEG